MDSVERSRVAWGAVIAGSLSAAALFFVLFGFGASLGLAMGSTAPTWRDASFALWLLSGLYLMLAALASFALGGYVAGRLRHQPAFADDADAELSGGMHGLVTWALAVLIGAMVVAAGARALSPVVSPPGGQSGQMSSLGGENLLAFELDKLFRSDRRPAAADDLTYARSEAGRILLTSSGHSGVAADDRAYLVRLVSTRTGLAGPDAEQRVNAIIAQSRTSLSRARKAGVLMGFITAASLLLGAAVSWFACQRGERDAYGSDISPYDTVFRAGRIRAWFEPARPRSRPGDTGARVPPA